MLLLTRQRREISGVCFVSNVNPYPFVGNRVFFYGGRRQVAGSGNVMSQWRIVGTVSFTEKVGGSRVRDGFCMVKGTNNFKLRK